MAKYIIVDTINDVQLNSHSPTIMPVQYGPQLDFGYLYLSRYKLKECCSNFGKTCSIKEHLSWTLDPASHSQEKYKQLATTPPPLDVRLSIRVVKT